MKINVKHTEIDLPRRKFASSAEAKPRMEAARQRFQSLKNADYITMRNAELDMFGAEDLYYLALELEEGEPSTINSSPVKFRLLYLTTPRFL